MNNHAKKLIFLVLLSIALLAAGCAGKKKVEDMEKTQKDILARLSAVEKNQKEIMKMFRRGKRRVDYNRVYKIPVGNSAVRGNPDAPVTIVEFSDFQCPYCAGLQPTLKKVLTAYPDDVRLVYKDFPLSRLHNQAENAARAARAAGEQGKYWEMHDLIFENNNKLSDDMFRELAERLNLDIARFMADYRSRRYDKQIQEDINLGRSIGVTGTPTLFINGKRMRSRSFNDFRAAIEAELKKQQKNQGPPVP